MAWHSGPPINRRKWRIFRRQIFERDGWTCQRCGKQGGRFECHHPHPVSKGGAIFDAENALTFCRPCHLDHHRKPETPESRRWKILLDRF